MRSIVQNGLTPGGFSTTTSRYAVFFIVVEPMDDRRGLRETFCDLSRARIASYKKILGNTSELFKVIQVAILLILHYRTMSLFRTVSSCTFIMSDVQSIYIPSSVRESLSKRQTVFFLLVDPMDKEHKDLDTIDLEAPRLAQYMHKAWKKYQNTVYWVDVNFALTKGSKFNQTRSKGITLHETLPACCIPKVVRMEKQEKSYTRKYMRHLGFLQKISLKHGWMKELGFRSCSTTKRKPQGEVRREPAGLLTKNRSCGKKELD